MAKDEVVASAAAPAARCRNFRRGSFIAHRQCDEATQLGVRSVRRDLLGPLLISPATTPACRTRGTPVHPHRAPTNYGCRTSRRSSKGTAPWFPQHYVMAPTYKGHNGNGPALSASPGLVLPTRGPPMTSQHLLPTTCEFQLAEDCPACLREQVADMPPPVDTLLPRSQTSMFAVACPA